MAPGFVAIAGGKLTTYRVMARDVINRAVVHLGRDAVPSRTGTLPVVGAAVARSSRDTLESLRLRYRLTERTIMHLFDRYGSETADVLGLGDDDPALLEALPGAGDYLAAEVEFAVRSEGALHVEDVLTRRTRISFECHDRGVEAAPVVAGILARHLGWSEERTREEGELYRRRVDAERLAQDQLDDSSADEARASVSDPRPLSALS